MILQTGGTAVGEISTRSSPASSARKRARSGDTTPMFSPFAPIRRISLPLMRSLIRGPVSRTGGALWGLRPMAVVLWVVQSYGAAKYARVARVQPAKRENGDFRRCGGAELRLFNLSGF